MLNVSRENSRRAGQTRSVGAWTQHNRVVDIDPGVTVSRHRALLIRRQYARTHFQCAKRAGTRSSSPLHHF